MDYSGTLETDGVLIMAGIDPEAMGYLSAKERREILVKAGLNPKEFDFTAIECTSYRSWNVHRTGSRMSIIQKLECLSYQTGMSTVRG